MLHYRLHRDPRSSHGQIARLVRRLNREPLLDVGAAQGILGRLLHEAGVTLCRDAVEPDVLCAELARSYYCRVFASAVEEAALPANTYALVVCADVLEHLPDPVAALRRLRRAARPDAVFIVSLPNMAHLAVRLLLLFGRLPRMDRGPLDRTHLQFFTHDTAVAMLREANLRVIDTRVTGIPLEEIWPGGQQTWLWTAASQLQRLALALFPRLFAYQWVFIAAPVACQQDRTDGR